MNALPVITVYSRRGCHLCEELIEELVPIIRGRAELVVTDVDTDAALAEAYGTRVPVVEMAGRELCEYRLDREALGRVL